MTGVVPLVVCFPSIGVWCGEEVSLKSEPPAVLSTWHTSSERKIPISASVLVVMFAVAKPVVPLVPPLHVFGFENSLRPPESAGSRAGIFSRNFLSIVFFFFFLHQAFFSVADDG